MSNVVTLKKPFKKADKPAKSLEVDQALVRECVAYAQAFAAIYGGYKADPDGDSAHAMPMSIQYRQRVEKALQTITKTPAKSAYGLQAKARIVPMVIEDTAGSPDEREEAFFLSFAADVQAFLATAVHDQWAMKRGLKSSEPQLVK